MDVTWYNMSACLLYSVNAQQPRIQVKKFLSTIGEWVNEQRKEINCYMVKVCKKAEKISFLFRRSNTCKNNIDISLKTRSTLCTLAQSL